VNLKSKTGENSPFEVELAAHKSCMIVPKLECKFASAQEARTEYMPIAS
jgi:hypothetical protein